MLSMDMVGLGCAAFATASAKALDASTSLHYLCIAIDRG
jgi:hypothetical protein